MKNMYGYNLVPIYTQEQIRDRVKELGINLSNKFRDEIPVFIGILNGSFVFLADLMRELTIDCEMDFIKLSSYEKTHSTGTVHLLKDISADITDRHVIIVEDIIDSGLTIRFIRDRLLDAQPISVSIVTLLMKPELAEIDFDVNWVGFEIPPHYVVGYGLDYDQKFRNLRGVFRLGGKQI
jgi:hypoxanthine phosphoribosyltransferase